LLPLSPPLCRLCVSPPSVCFVPVPFAHLIHNIHTPHQEENGKRWSAYYLDPLGTGRQGAGTTNFNNGVRAGLKTIHIELGSFKSVSGWKQTEGSLDCGFVCLAMVTELVHYWKKCGGVLRPWYPDVFGANCLVPDVDWQVTLTPLTPTLCCLLP
jgi:hypothetical protein